MDATSTGGGQGRRRRGLAAAGAVLLGVLMLASVPAAEPGDASGTPANPASDAFFAAGLDAQVRALADAVAEAGEARAAELAPDAADRLRRALAAAAAPAERVMAAHDRFVATADARHAERASAFFRSPTGLRVREIERASEAGIDDEALSPLLDELFAKPVPVERVRVLGRLAEATRGAELSALHQAVAERVVARALRAAAPDTHGDDWLAGALDAIERERVTAAARWRSQSSVLMQLVYRDATDAEIAAYAEFAESEAGRWLAEATAGMFLDFEFR